VCGKFVLGKSATSGAVAVFDYLVASRQPQENAALVMRTMVEGGDASIGTRYVSGSCGRQPWLSKRLRHSYIVRCEQAQT
jgi:hypothetical protein